MHTLFICTVSIRSVAIVVGIVVIVLDRYQLPVRQCPCTRTSTAELRITLNRAAVQANVERSVVCTTVRWE